MGRYQHAVADYGHAIRLDPSLANAYGGTRKSEGPQQGAASELGQAGRTPVVIGPKGACATTRASESGQKPSGVCDYSGGFGPHHRASRDPNEGRE